MISYLSLNIDIDPDKAFFFFFFFFQPKSVDIFLNIVGIPLKSKMLFISTHKLCFHEEIRQKKYLFKIPLT